MKITMYICDYCGEPIEYDEKKKYKTPEMGYPYIKKGGGGKNVHFHYNCLVKSYKEKKDLTKDAIEDLIADAERRHNSHIEKHLRKGTLTKDKFILRKATKKDKDSLVNYFYSHYGLRVLSKNASVLIDKLNAGEDYGNYKNIQISYIQLKNMLIYYNDDLMRIYKSKLKKGEKISPTERIVYDISIVIANLDDYNQRREKAYCEMNSIGSEEVVDYSKALEGTNKKRIKESQEEFEKLEMMKKFADEEIESLIEQEED